MFNKLAPVGFLYLISSISLGQGHDPIADPSAIVVQADVRFTVLTPRVIRLEWTEDQIFEDRASLTFVRRNLSVPSFQKDIEDGWLILKTEALTLRYRVGSGAFTENNLRITFQHGETPRVWHPGLEDTGNLLGTTRTLDRTDGSAFMWNPYEDEDEEKEAGEEEAGRRWPIRLDPGVISRDGWLVIDDSQRPLFDNSDWPWVTPRPIKNHQDWYFFGCGYDYRQALYDFTQLAGKIALPPRFIFGYWYSRWWPYTDQSFKELVEKFESLDIPLDVLVIDMDWHITCLPEFFKEGRRIDDQAKGMTGWTGFTWNQDMFPDPEGFIRWTDSKRLKTCLNLHPASGIQPHEKKYPDMARAMGIDPASRKYVPFDIVDKKYAQNYFDIIVHPLEEMGIDFWWLDWQQWSTTNIPGVNPTFYLNYVHFTDMQRQGKKRPMIYHRYGGLGNHRYQIGFSGDTKVSWASLDYQPYFTATAANVGFGYWGHDIGGHHLDDTQNDPELFTRWFQFGIFSPLLKTHATLDRSIKRKLWEYPHDTFFHLRDLIHLRYALIPYIYTAARNAYDSGISICHPMYYDYPQQDEGYRFKNQYMFGEELLVSPVTHPIGEDSLFTFQHVWLPEGQWYEWTSGIRLEGGRVIKQPFTVTEIPVYVKAGAIIPMQPRMDRSDEKPVDPLILNIFLGASGSTRIYEDEGINQNYKNGLNTWTPVRFKKSGRKLRVVIDPVEGEFPGMLNERAYEIRIVHSFPPEKVTINRKSLNYHSEVAPGSWTYDGKALTTRIFTSQYDVRSRKTIDVVFPNQDTALLNKKVGRMRNLYEFSKYLAGAKNFFVLRPWNDAEYSSDLIFRSAQAGYVISLHPENIYAELEAFDRNWEAIISMLEQASEKNGEFRPFYDLLKSK